jgi:hypothetical protein
MGAGQCDISISTLSPASSFCRFLPSKLQYASDRLSDGTWSGRAWEGRGGGGGGTWHVGRYPWYMGGERRVVAVEGEGGGGVLWSERGQ